MSNEIKRPRGTDRKTLPDTLKPYQVALYLRLSRQGAMRLIDSGVIPHTKTDDNYRVIKKSDLLKFVGYEQ